MTHPTRLIPVLLSACFGLLAVTHTLAAKPEPVRLGVILVQPDDKPSQLAEATAVQLLADLDAQPVERPELDQVIKEQSLSLSALSDPAAALAVGKALRADALLIIEPNGQHLYARVMDTWHGVILTEALLESRQPDSFTNTLRSILTSALQKTLVPPEEMVYVSVMGITASADVERLKSAASQLGPLIRADLQAIPHVRVVEREQLAQIKRETQLVGGEASIVGSAVVIEGELRPLDGGDKAEIVILVTDLSTQKPISLKTVSTEAGPAELREAARGVIAEHLALVETKTPTLAGPAEAAALIARAHWRVSHQDFDSATGLVEAGLLIDDAPERLQEAWWVYYHMGSNLGYLPPLIDTSLGIKAIRRRQEVRLQRLRHPSSAKELSRRVDWFPIHYHESLRNAKTKQDKHNLEQILKTYDDVYGLAMEYHLEKGLDVTRLIGSRLGTLPLWVASGEEYVTRAKALILQMREEMGDGDEWSYDPVILGVDDNFMWWEAYDHKPENLPLLFGYRDAKPLFDWMLTQDDLGLHIIAQWYTFKFSDEENRTEEALKLLKILCEDIGMDRPEWVGTDLGSDTVDGHIATDPVNWLMRVDLLGEWIDGLLDRVEASGDIDPLLRWNASRFVRLIDFSESEGLREQTDRLEHFLALLSQIEVSKEQAHGRDVLLRYGTKLEKKIADRKTPETPDAWDAYNSQLITVKGVGEDMRHPAVYLLTGQRGDTDRTLYIAWFTTEPDVWVFTRCAMRGGDLKRIGKARLQHINAWGKQYLQMVVVNNYLVAGGVDGLVVVSQKDGSVARYGTEQGLPGAFVRSLDVVGDQVVVGCATAWRCLTPKPAAWT